MNQNRCILCGKCVRICDEVQGEGELDFVERGFPTVVEPSFARKMDCEFCGQCIQVCPVGSLYSRIYKHTAPSWELDPVRTTCPFCGVGCTLELEVKGNRIYHVLGVDDEGSNNDGFLCCKGRFGYEYVHSPDRLTEPMIKKNGEMVPATWDEAYDLITDKFTEMIKDNGPDSIGGIASARCTNEENFLFQKFMRAAIGTNNVDSIARFGHFPGMEALRKAFGVGAPTNSLADLAHTDLILAVDSNITEDDHVAGLKVLKQVRSGKAKLITANSRGIKLSRFSDLWMKHRAGSSVALLNSMAHVVLEENLQDEKFCARRVTGLQELTEFLRNYSPEEMEKATGVAADEVREAARMVAAAKDATIIITLGGASPYTGEDTVAAAANLALITGNVGRMGAGLIPLSEYNNIQGSMDMGALAQFLPGYQDVSDEGIRSWFEEQWHTELSSKPGLDAMGMMQAAKNGSVKGLYIMGENPLASFPDRNLVMESLEKLNFLVVQDMFFTETALLADVVLPASCGPEKNGTFTNTDRRVQRVRKAIDPPDGTRDDWKIVMDLSNALGYAMEYETAMDVSEEITHTIAFYSGIKPERLEKNGLHWPCPRPDHEGTDFLHDNRFPSGLGRTRLVEYQKPKKASTNYPYLLVPGTILYHSGTTTTNSPGLNEVAPVAVAEINPADAKKLEVKTGDWVRLTSLRGMVDIRVEVSRRTQEGTVFAPTHYQDTPINSLTSYEPQNEKGVTHVSVERIEKFVETPSKKDAVGQVTQLKKTMEEIHEKRQKAKEGSEPDASGG
jgi:formate dehydrogenase alpha subunit